MPAHRLTCDLRRVTYREYITPKLMFLRGRNASSLVPAMGSTTGVFRRHGDKHVTLGDLETKV
jgi:hypothetical protein